MTKTIRQLKSQRRKTQFQEGVSKIMKCRHCVKSAEQNKVYCSFHLIEYRKKKGQEWADILCLPYARLWNAEHKDRTKRYATTWGNKTPLGIYETIKRLVKEGEQLCEV